MAKKPAPKPVRKPSPKAPKLKGPDMAPINAVRNPNFGAAMAQQDYFNNLSRLIAERNARGPESGIMPIGGTGITAEQIQNLSPDRRQALEQRMAIDQFQRNLANQMPIDGQNATAYQRNADGSLVPVQAPRPIEGDQRLPIQVGAQPNLPSNFIGQVPQNAQMQNYNNFLQQGMQNSNTLNQSAMANFANMQPGMQASQQARPTAPNQAMPIAGMGMQQSRKVPAQRKLSTFNNTPVRFG